MVNGKVAILGGRGMLGSDIAIQCAKLNIPFEVFDLPSFDITNQEHLINALKNTDAVINCAAYTNVDKAESESDLAFKINADAVGTIGRIAKNLEVWVLHISTDFVFDGTLGRPYNEDDKPNPINAYGKSKLAGEKLLIASGCDHCIIRAEWTYGKAGNNFIAKLLSHAKQNDSLRVVDDQVGSPTATVEVAKTICQLLRKKPNGVFHFAADDYTTRFDMAKFLFHKLNMNIKLSSCKTSEFKSPANRPLNSRFNCDKIKKLLDHPIKPWREPLEEFIKQL